ncbi:hypothetical protein [Polaromonas sp.]|uniref:hypothetical protein n=1 Tax=Polaromonas sp. TaxID=1869339 RepID=UPI003CBEACE9
MNHRWRLEIPRPLVIPAFLLLAGFWLVLFMSDAGNFWHGGTAAGLILSEAVAAIGILAFVDVLRSDASKRVKVALALPAAPLVLFTAFGLFYAVQRAIAV